MCLGGQYVQHYHMERPHQAMENNPLMGSAQVPSEMGGGLPATARWGVAALQSRGGVMTRADDGERVTRSERDAGVVGSTKPSS